MENGKNQHSLSFKASLEEKDKTRQAGPLSIYTVHRPIQLRVGYGLCVECIYVFSSPNESGQTNRADNMRGGILGDQEICGARRLYVRGDIHQLGFDLN
jgi:hypothetical protein